MGIFLWIDCCGTMLNHNLETRTWDCKAIFERETVMHHNQPTVGGTPVATFLQERLAELVPAVLDELVAEIPIYQRLPTELIQGDVRRVVQQAVQTFADALALDGSVSRPALDGLTESALRRAEEGVPLEMVLAAYYHGAGVCLDSLGPVAGPKDVGDILRLSRALVRFMEAVTAAVAEGYSRHIKTAYADQASARQLMVNALLDGTDVALAASRAAVRLPEHYLVLSLVAGTHPDESDPAVDAQVAGQRKLRRLREELVRHYPDALWVPATDGGLGLIAHDERSEGRLDTALRGVQVAAGVAVHVGVVVATPQDVGAAARTAREIADVAQGLGRPAGPFWLRDVALDYQLTRPTPARDLLADVLRPLETQPELARTLRAYLTSGQNRRRAATELHIHPNTLDNRLHRVADLTGLHPTRPADLPVILAAVAAMSAS